MPESCNATSSEESRWCGDPGSYQMNARCPLQVVGAGPVGMSLVLALCNRVAAASGKGGIHGFQSYPLAIAPRIIDCLTAHIAVEKVH